MPSGPAWLNLFVQCAAWCRLAQGDLEADLSKVLRNNSIVVKPGSIQASPFFDQVIVSGVLCLNVARRGVFRNFSIADLRFDRFAGGLARHFE